MLDDRKFYYPINSHPPAEPPAANPMRRPPLRHWTPVGGDEFVTMDTSHPYAGDHTPAVKLGAKEAHGFQQAGLAVRKGKSYTGRIVLAGTPGASVKATKRRIRSSPLTLALESIPNCARFAPSRALGRWLRPSGRGRLPGAT